MSFINDFTISKYFAVKCKRNRLGSQDRFMSGAYRDFNCFDCEAETVDENSRFPVLIT